MSTELVPTTPAVVFNPSTGEIIDLNSEDQTLVQFLDDLAQFEKELDSTRRTVNRELVARLDRSAKWTRHVGPYTLSAASPSPTEDWDGAALHEALAPFVDRGELSVEALDAAVETVVSYKPKKAGINALRKLGGDVKTTVDGLKREKEKGDRRVRIERPLR